MRIRSHQIYSATELYSLYKTAYKANEVFDAYTLNFSVYAEPDKFLNENEFRQDCKRTQLNQYAQCTTYNEYKKAQKEHMNVVLTNNVVLTIFTDYNEHEFEKVLAGGFIKSVRKEPLIGLAEQIYNSNKIENIDITLHDTKTLLAGGSIANIKYDDELAVLNAKDAFELRDSMKGFVVNPYYISKLHYELMKGLRDDAGRFRNHDVFIGSASHSFPSYEHVPTMIKNLTSFVSDDNIMLASLIHAEFVNIHPFSDGNGRIGRLIVHPYGNVPFEDRLEYYTALDAYGRFKSIYALYTLFDSINPVDSVTPSAIFD